MVNNIFLLVVRNRLGPKEIAEWQENLVFMEYLASNLGNQSHNWAMQKLKEVFGGKQGMSAGKKKLADRIVRETPQRTQGMLPQINLPPPPQQFFGGGLRMMAPMHPVPFVRTYGKELSFLDWSCERRKFKTRRSKETW